MSPVVSVIIPTYNRAHLIERSVNSVLSQTFTDYELIVVDDGSVDETELIMRQYPQVKYIKKTNGGQASARNEGMKHANGEYVSTLDSDDYWQPGFLATCVEALGQYDLDFVFANYQRFTDNGTTSKAILYKGHKELQRYFNSPDDENAEWVLMDPSSVRIAFLQSNPAPSSAIVYRRKSVVQEWDGRLKVSDDWDFTLSVIFARPECKVALYKKPVWMKHYEGDNIYDKLNDDEVALWLIEHDAAIFIRKYEQHLSRKEKKAFDEVRTYCIYKGVMYGLQHRHFAAAFKHLVACFRVSPSLTFQKMRTYGFPLRKKQAGKSEKIQPV